MWKGIILLGCMLLFLAACSGNDQGNAGDTTPYDPATFEFAMPNTTGEAVSLVPNGKTLYLYFTGVG